MTEQDFKIIHFDKKYSKDFYNLNVEWLKKHFYVEPYDEKVLSDPQKFIIDKGGFIFFVILEDEIIGTVALINQNTYFELSKMAISPRFRGQKIGEKLMEFCINFKKKQKWDSITLYSHRKLVPAINLYMKFGFIEIPVEENSHYERANIKMILKL